MTVRNMTDFRNHMKETMDSVYENDETVIISRSNQKDIVLISLKTFNSIQETLYLMSSSKNKMRLDQAVEDLENNRNMLVKDLLI